MHVRGMVCGLNAVIRGPVCSPHAVIEWPVEGESSTTFSTAVVLAANGISACRSLAEQPFNQRFGRLGLAGRLSWRFHPLNDISAPEAPLTAHLSGQEHRERHLRIVLI
jgi:hypothetical protein